MNHVTSDKLCAVITSFYPDKAFDSRIRLIAGQVNKVIVVNDSGSPFVEDILEEQLSNFQNLVLLHNSKNVGIAASLNTGVKYAINAGYEYFLTLDQDTVVCDDMVKYLLTELQYAHTIVNRPIGVFALSYKNHVSDKTAKYHLCSNTLERNFKKKRGVITSGSLIHQKSFEEVEGFREEFFIDSVDYDYCMKLRKLDYVIITSSTIGFIQEIGQPKTHHFLWYRFDDYHHIPLRQYYYFRNSLTLSREHLFNDPAFSLTIWIHQITRLFKGLVSNNDKRRFLRYSLLGIKDSLFQKLGSFSYDFSEN